MAAVVVVGSINVDLIFRIPSLPAPGETVTGGEFTTAPGGKGANQAAAAARLGARTWFVGNVGADDLGRAARQDLARAGVDVTYLEDRPEAHTGTAAILVDARGENSIAVAPGANRHLSPARAADALASIDAEGAVVLSVLEIPLETVLTAAGVARDRRWAFVLTPAPARELPAELVALCDVLIPNEHEVTALGWSSVSALLEAGARALVVTRGAAGAELHEPPHGVRRQEAYPVEPRDTTGAGDAFSGALAWALAEGRGLEEAVRLAAAAGALATRAVGARASLPDRAELERFASLGVV